MTNSRLKGSVLNGDRTKLFGSHASKEIRSGLLALGIAIALLLLNGCASALVHSDTQPWQYNQNSGYPATGGPSWGRF